jgi:hypothetical protein
MNNIEVSGGKAYQQRYVHSIAQFCIDKLMPRMKTLDINIRLKTINEDSYGYCLSTSNREFEIEIDKDMPLRRLLETVAHEMVHVRQYARKQLTGDYTWQGKTYHPKCCDYWDQPWEIEAHGREVGLFIRWAESQKIGHKKWTLDN